MKLAINTVTLRSLTPQEVVSTISNTGIAAVEWAGDLHVPPGNIAVAKQVKELSEAAGLTITSYGAYYQCDNGEAAAKGPFASNLGAQAALDSAQALGASAIRVWAGRHASALASKEYRAEVVSCLTNFCDLAKALNLSVHLEFHRNTLTDTAASTLQLLDAVSRENLFSYWQPRHGVGVEANVADIQALGERLSNAHVFHWLLQEPGGSALDRRPLAEGKDCWQAYFAALEQLPGDRYAMLEFVRGDSLEQFFEDAQTLQDWNASLQT